MNARVDGRMNEYGEMNEWVLRGLIYGEEAPEPEPRFL